MQANFGMQKTMARQNCDISKDLACVMTSQSHNLFNRKKDNCCDHKKAWCVYPTSVLH